MYLNYVSGLDTPLQNYNGHHRPEKSRFKHVRFRS